MDIRTDDWMDLNWDDEEGSDINEAAASKASDEVYVIFSVYDWSGALVYWAGTSEVESKKAWLERSLDFFEYGPDDVSNLIYVRFSKVPMDVIDGVCSKDQDTANCYLRILFGADPAEAADSDPNWDPDGCPFPVDILGEHNGIDAYYDLAALGYDVDNIENWPDNKYRDLIAKHHLNESNSSDGTLKEAGSSNSGKESLYVIFYHHDRSKEYQVYWAGKDSSQARVEWRKNLADFFGHRPDAFAQIWFVKFVNLDAAMIQGLLNYEKDEKTAHDVLVKACLDGRTTDDFSWNPEVSQYVGKILAIFHGTDTKLLDRGYDLDYLASRSLADLYLLTLATTEDLGESAIKESVDDDNIEDDFVEEVVDEEVAHSMDREELKQIIKQIIERDTKNGDWFDVDTIAYDVGKEYPDVKTDTDEFYDLEIECIAEANEDAETEDDPSQYRIVKVSYCSDDYDINVEFGIIDPDEEEYDVVDQEWLLKPDQTMEDLENYLYDKEGVTNLDMGDPEVITQDQAATEYKYSQKF